MTGKYIDEEEGTENKWKTGKMKKQMKVVEAAMEG